VLAYEDRVLNDAEPSDGLPASNQSGLPAPSNSSAKTTRQQNTRRIRTAVLAVPEPDTTRVMLGASLGELRLSLRSAQPEDTAPGELLPSSTAATAAAQTGPAQSDQKDQVVTLRELAAIRKKQGPAASQDAPAIIIYRGSDVQRVSR
ncbi:MAG: hypothetical protein ACRESV_05055, partial [Nevskiales bacterium]